MLQQSSCSRAALQHAGASIRALPVFLLMSVLIKGKGHAFLVWSQRASPRRAQAIRLFGTDFSLIERMFPGRQRKALKNKLQVRGTCCSCCLFIAGCLRRIPASCETRTLVVGRASAAPNPAVVVRCESGLNIGAVGVTARALRPLSLLWWLGVGVDIVGASASTAPGVSL